MKEVKLSRKTKGTGTRWKGGESMRDNMRNAHPNRHMQTL